MLLAFAYRINVERLDAYFETAMEANLRHTNTVILLFHSLSLNNVKEEQIIRISNALTKNELNATDDDANTLLHLAAKKGYNNLFAGLLNLGADPTLRNKDGSTAIDLFNVP